jgi:hypothetical protein
MDCSEKMYHKNELGNSRKCTCQGAIHVTFGNVSLLLSKPQLSGFATYIAEALFSECDVEDRNERCIFLPTRDYCLMFAMSYNELLQLCELLEQTLLMMQVEDALSMN